MTRSRAGVQYRGCYVQAKAPAVREKDWFQVVYDAARLLGWHCYHTLRSAGSTPGFPDLVCARDGKLLVIELKTEMGKVTPAQEHWLDLFAAIPGVVTMVARPSDWERVEAALKEAS